MEIVNTAPTEGTAKTKKSSRTEEIRGNVLEVLQALLEEGRSAEVIALVSKLVSKNSELELRLAKLLVGRRKNEGVSAGQLKLFLDSIDEMSTEAQGGAEVEEASQNLRASSGIDEQKSEKEKSQPPKQPSLRKPAPAHLRRIDNPILVPDEERACPKCGKEREKCGHEITEVIELIPAEVVVRRDIVEKLICRPCDGEMIRAEVGDKVVSGGKLGPGLVSDLLVEKYDDGIPLHRQKRRLARLGFDVSVSTLADQIMWATDLLRPLWRLAIEQTLLSKIMHLDGTSLPVLDKGAPGGKRLGSLWGYVGNTDVAVYLYTSTGKKRGQRKGELGPEDMLMRRKGHTVADASNIFETSFEREDLIECGCNMHSRRYFVKALDAGDARAALPIAGYKKIYEIEAEIRDKDEGAKLAARQARSKPVFDDILAWCKAMKPNEPPSSPMGEALRYMTNHAIALGRFLEEGFIPIDNGIVERFHVRAALTRKNFLFAGSDVGGERAAIAYTILACCRLVDVNPAHYLRDVLPLLSRRIRLSSLAELMPAQWKARRDAERARLEGRLGVEDLGVAMRSN